MTTIWPVNLQPADKEQIQILARRRAALGLPHTFAATIRASIALALATSDEDLDLAEEDIKARERERSRT